MRRFKRTRAKPKLRKSRYGPYEYEDKDLSEELNENLSGNPNTARALLEISGMKDWSSYDYILVDEKLSFNGDIVHYDDLLDYVMYNYCTFNSDTIEYKYLSISLMLSIVNNDLRYYRLNDDYENEMKFLLNTYYRLLSRMNRSGAVVVDSRFE